MARRGAAAYDRLAGLLLAAALLGVAALAAAGWLRATGRQLPAWLPAWLPGRSPGRVPDRLDLTALQQLLDRAWWPWAGLAGGLLLVLLGLLALLLHLPARGPRSLRLPGSDPSGTLEVGTGPLTDGLTMLLAEVPGVRRSSGRVERHRDGLVARLQVTLDPQADLADLAAAGDRAARTLQDLTGRADLRCELQARVSGRTGSRRRPGRRVTGRRVA